MDKNSENAVVEVARDEKKGGLGKIHTLQSGVRVTVTPVTAQLIDKVTSKIKDPDPPVWYNEDKGREEPNYSDPAYNRKLAETERERGVAAMDAIMMFGFELVDGLPEDDRWIKKLKLLGVEDVNVDDEIEAEFAYKKYVAVAPDEIALVTDLSGISSEELEAAEASFRSTST